MAAPQQLNFRTLLVDGGKFLLILCILGVAVAGFVPLSHPFIARKVADVLRKAGAENCSVGKGTVVVWKSVSCSNIAFTVRIDSIRTCRVQCAEMSLRTSLPALLLHRSPLEGRKQSKQTVGSIAARNAALLRVYERIHSLLQLMARSNDGSISDVAVTVSADARELLRCVGGTVILKADREQTGELRAKVRFPVVNIAGDGVQELECSVTASPSGKIGVNGISGVYFDGKAGGKIAIDLQKQQIDSYEGTIEQMDMSYWYTVHGGIGEITGKLNLQAKGERLPLVFPPRTTDLNMVLQQCTITGLPIQHALATSLFIPSLATIPFSVITADIGINEGDTITTDIRGEGDTLDFSSHGWVLTDGSLQQKLEGVFSKVMINSFPPMVKNSLEPAGKGKRRFTCRLFGTFAEPRFELDDAILRRAVGSMFEGLRQDVIDIHNGKK
jgi:hypothetical protein